jgi:hypothetical protein
MFIGLSVACLCVCPAIAQSGQRSRVALQAAEPQFDHKQAAAKPSFPLQLEMRVPFDPTAFPSGQFFYLMYELHLTNFGPSPLSLSRIDVLDPGAAGTGAAGTGGEGTSPLASFEGTHLEAIWKALGGNAASSSRDSVSLDAGQSAIVFMSVTFERGSRIADRLMHRIITSDSSVEGAIISTHHTELHVLEPPVEGSNWLADDGPSNDPDNHHRRGVIIVDGQAVDSRRYAIDWKQVKEGAAFSGDSRDVRSYYSYGQAVRAVADSRVVTARDRLPDNVPGHGEAFHPAVPITLETVAGNTITLDLGGGQFAHYMHLQPGSLRVKAGDYVRRGQVLARIGASGDAREPHLHFEVTTSAKLLAGEGVPYLIDRYRSLGESGEPPEVHIHELPHDKDLVAFGDF